MPLAAPLAGADLPEDINLDGDPEAGRQIAFDRSKGNCVSCHVITGVPSPGSIGPVLTAIQTRFPSKRELAKQIWDPMVRNPDAVMPPFGRHEILLPKEFADVVSFVWTL
ncbi:sulfur oxidation c-type cytochrome SoxX [Caldichromatium japonicum]|uniref:Sulfur oxidation c-type cytochrome SoxX n=2 Tax=Caldichromatium japonicum TaxID=2699430 RepID=A0A6G7VH60_9GAMM|nr:sulfur oxidation c-type cytochrome SoxX [Caldichromatium japonicum]